LRCPPHPPRDFVAHFPEGERLLNPVPAHGDHGRDVFAHIGLLHGSTLDIFVVVQVLQLKTLSERRRLVLQILDQLRVVVNGCQHRRARVKQRRDTERPQLA